jgi:hypothetical protein
MTKLGKAEKLQLIDSRVKQLDYKKYALELDIIVENAKNTPDTEAINVIEASIAEIDTQLAALDAELTAVNALTE